jgi:cytochrome o ubiquinol oxidase operon protein cyoD
MYGLEQLNSTNKLAAQTNHKTLSGYVIGFSLSMLLTLLAFGSVTYKVFADTAITYIVLALLAVLQLLVQAIFFLRLNTSAAGRENLLTWLFTMAVVIIIISGSLWIMYNLNYNMIH